MKEKPISVLLDKDLFSWLDKHCKRTGKTKSGLVRAMLNEKKKVDDLEETERLCGLVSRGIGR